MVGLLKVDEIQKADGRPVILSNQDTLKAWVRFNQLGTVAIDNSFNTSSITDVGTGHAWVHLATAMQDISYSLVGMAGELAGGGNRGVGMSGTSGALTASRFTLRSFNSSGTGTDTDFVNVAVLGDLA